jgi:surface antigen
VENNAMPPSAKTVALILASLAAASAQAQLLGPGWETNITLKQDDIDLIHRTVDQQIHGKAVGTTATWSNPATGNAGTIKLLKKDKSKNLQCETVQYTLTTTARRVSPEHYTFHSCLQPDGTWKIS